MTNSVKAIRLSDLISVNSNGSISVNSTLSSSDLDSLGDISFAYIKNGSTNQPPNTENGNFGVITFGDSDAKIQVAVSNGNLYSRLFNGSTWFDWSAGGGLSLSGKQAILDVNGTEITTDLNGLTLNSFRNLNNGSTNEPVNTENGNFGVFTMGDANSTMQLAVSNGGLHARMNNGSNWTDWFSADGTTYSGFRVQDIDQTDGKTSYIGRESRQIANQWIVTRTRDSETSYATINGNAAHTTFNAAWTNRASLTFKDEIGGGAVVP